MSRADLQAVAEREWARAVCRSLRLCESCGADLKTNERGRCAACKGAEMLHASEPSCCPRSHHDAIKADPVRWRTETEFLGHQDSETEDGDEAIAELALCRRCGSTLALEIELVPVEIAS